MCFAGYARAISHRDRLTLTLKHNSNFSKYTPKVPVFQCYPGFVQ